ncbi:hypothetical protein AHAS_Ahas08G0018000 [Arachis hypogaea]
MSFACENTFSFVVPCTITFAELQYDEIQHDSDVEDDRATAYEKMNNNNDEEFEATYEAGDEDDESNGGRLGIDGFDHHPLIYLHVVRMGESLHTGIHDCTRCAVMAEIDVGDDKEMTKTLHNSVLSTGVAAEMVAKK